MSASTDYPAALPASFLFGAATSSYQIEGGAADRHPSIWDTFCDRPGTIADGSDGSTACDHVTHWRADIDHAAEMGLDAYRLSLSWPRLMAPDGTLRRSGVDFYRRLLGHVADRGMKCFVTFYHWDLPQYVEDGGGWLNRDTAALFRNYVAQVSRALGDLVDAWATLNEPFCSAYLGYETGVHAPGLTGVDRGRAASHVLLLAHGMALAALRRTCPDTPVGIVVNYSPCLPATDTAEDRRAAHLAEEYKYLWYLMPVLEGRYPDAMGALSADQRPAMKEGDMTLIAGNIDFLGLNYYTEERYQAGENGFAQLSDAGPEATAMGWKVAPDGLRRLLLDLNTRFRLPPVYITENGIALKREGRAGTLEDRERWDFIHAHIRAVAAAVADGVDVRGYFAWSLLDNFEWAEGYEKRFGLIHVTYADQSRRWKQSAHAYRRFLAERPARNRLKDTALC